MESHQLFEGRLYIYKRPGSQFWQCSAYLGGKNRRTSTKHEDLAHAKKFAENWYIDLRTKDRFGELGSGRTFADAAEKFELEYEVITHGHRSPKYVQMHKEKLRVHLIPFFGKMPVTQITPGKVQEYRLDRLQKPRNGKPPARSTLAQELVTFRQVLKTAYRHGWIPFVPDISAPYKTSGKVAHRAWFSPVDYRRLYRATRERANNPRSKQWKWHSQQLHDYVLFMANTGLRPDEAARLEYRDVTIIRDDDSDQVILLIEVRGKRGVGYCKSTTGAVLPFRRLVRRNTPAPTDRLFPKKHRELFNTVLDELGLKLDRDGNRRTAYSLRHTYICLRLMEGADIYQVAKNCRTSVEMIERHYAAHLKHTLDAAAINVRKPRRTRKKRRPRKR